MKIQINYNPDKYIVSDTINDSAIQNQTKSAVTKSMNDSKIQSCGSVKVEKKQK